MKIKTYFFDIKIDILFLIAMFIFLLSKKIQIFLYPYFLCYLFIIFHEASHMFVATIYGKEIEIFNIGIFGVNILFKKQHYNLNFNDEFKNKKEYLKNILIYIAGPMSNIFLAIIFKNIKEIYEINIFLCILNLLPIYPLDGYNILKIILLYNLNKSSVEKIINIVSYILFFILFILGGFGIILFYNPSLILFLIYLVILKLSYSQSKKDLKYYN